MSAVTLKWKKLNSAATIPSLATSGSAGFDFTACLVEPLTLTPNTVVPVPTGLAVEIPEGFELQVRARSGLAAKFGLMLANGIGTIDSDYRGEIKILAVIVGKNPLTIQPGERIAQGVVCAVPRVTHVEVDTLSETQRGVGGFGSTGVR
jgi:dUTP pyrophosphatase